MAPRASGRPGPGLLASFLLGLSAAGMSAGFLGLFLGSFDPLPETAIIVLAAGLVGLAAGPWLPQGLIGLVSARLLFQAMRPPSGAGRQVLVPLTADQPEAQEDRQFMLASSCLVTALAVLLMAALLTPIRAACEWLRTDFFWVPGIMRLADFLVAASVQFVPASLLGVALVCALGTRQDRPIGRAGARHLASLALGLGLGSGAALWWFRLILSSLLILLLSAVPLLVAVIATMLDASRESPEEDQTARRGPRARAAPPLPELGHAGLGVLLVALLFWSLSLAMGGVVWHWAADLWGPPAAAPCGLVGFWLSFVAVGAWLGGPYREGANQTLETSGVRMCLAALGTAAAILLVSIGSPSESQTGIQEQGGRWVLFAAVCVHGSFSGQALPALLGGTLSRFATRGLAHATILTAVSLGAAAGLLLAGCWLLGSWGGLVTICAACLVLVIAGGVLVIYDPLEGGRSHRWKLAAVFASLLLLMHVLPAAVPGWRPDRADLAGDGGAPAEGTARTVSAGLIASVPGARQSEAESPNGASGAVDSLLAQCLRGSRVCLIGGAPARWSGQRQPTGSAILQIDHWPHTRGGVAIAGADSPLARLRLARRRYHLVVFGPAGRGVQPNQDLWTSETFARLAGLLAPAGLAVVRVPLGGLEPADARTVARTFARGFDGRAAWSVLGADRPGEEAELWLVGSSLGGAPAWSAVVGAAGVSAPRPMKDLLAGSRSSGTHGAEHPRLRTKPARGSQPIPAETAALLSLAGGEPGVR